MVVNTTETGEVVFNPKMQNPENESKVMEPHNPYQSAWDSITYKPPTDGTLFG